jgi:hypothetical protein
MVAIHTYAPCGGDKYFLTKSHSIMMVLSVLLIKKLFDKVVLYTTKEMAEIVIKIGVPYDEIITEPFENYKEKTFSIPKLITYSLQTEPFIHLDFDSFLFSLPKDLKNIDIFASYQDSPIDEFTGFYGMLGIYDTYMNSTFEISKNLTEEFKSNINFFNIPNMCLFGGDDYNIIAESSKYCLEIYKNNRDFFNSKYNNACIIEQLFITTGIKMLENKEIDYIFPKNGNIGVFHNTNDMFTTTYPLKFGLPNETLIIYNEQQLYEMIDYEFFNILHLCGSKNLDTILFLLKEIIIKKFNGDKYINIINEIFPNIENFDEISIRYNQHE